MPHFYAQNVVTNPNVQYHKIYTRTTTTTATVSYTHLYGATTVTAIAATHNAKPVNEHYMQGHTLCDILF